MANIWVEEDHRHNENRGQLFSSNAKQFMSARKHSTKKQAFGEIKNVLHNQGHATPFKGGQMQKPTIHGGNFENLNKPSMFVNVLRKQQLKQNFVEAQRNLEQTLKPVQVQAAPAVKLEVAEPIPDLDDLEVPVNSCTKECSKSLETIWDEMEFQAYERIAHIMDIKIEDDTFERIADRDYYNQLAAAADKDPVEFRAYLPNDWDLFAPQTDAADDDDGLPLYSFEMPNYPDDDDFNFGF